MGFIHTGNGTIVHRGHPLPPKSPMEGNRIHKILVISEGNFPKEVESRTWEDVGKGTIPNIAEFDIVILNFVRMTPQKAGYIKDAPKFDIKTIHNLLWSGSELILITDGEVDIPLDSSTWWDIHSILPVSIPFVKERGETILVEDEKYRDYYETHVDHWNFYIKDECRFPDGAKNLLSERERVEYKFPLCQLSKIIARNGFDKPISFSIRYGYSYESENYISERHLSGPLTILQAPDKTESVESAIKTLLSHFGIHIKSKAPTWTNDFKIPGEEAVGREIKKLEAEKIRTEEKITCKEAEKEEITRYKKLLFEDGDELRNIVWDTLEQIGFKVNRHDEHKEDGSIQEGEEVAVLEIKGKGERSLTTEDVRQLDDWIGDYSQREGKEPIGILIGNHYRLKKPESRDEPFPPDVLRYVNARSTKLSMITTLQLFELFCMIKDGKLDAGTIRKEIMSNKGVFDLKSILE